MYQLIGYHDARVFYLLSLSLSRATNAPKDKIMNVPLSLAYNKPIMFGYQLLSYRQIGDRS